MNPGKVSDPTRWTPTCAWTRPTARASVPTHFRFPDDGGSFAEAAERCFGVGACRDQSGTMCQSYQVTLEEKHSTRGTRAFAVRDDARDSLDDEWRNEEVKEALDLCLACKGCKHECPVRVDMATYKAEFLSHYWKGRLRPRHAYAMGLIPWEARRPRELPAGQPAHQREPIAELCRRAAGIAPERKPPPFARQTLREWFRVARAPHAAARAGVLVWPDTFNNFFDPEVGVATVEVLEAAGFEVVLRERMLCCGRPLYDYGMLHLAEAPAPAAPRRAAPRAPGGHAGGGARAELRCGVPRRAHPDAARRRGRQAAGRGSRARWASCSRARRPTSSRRRRGRRALVHLHCHQKATSDTDCDLAVLERLGIEAEVLDSGCCGVAGSFGYEPRRALRGVGQGRRARAPARRAQGRRETRWWSPTASRAARRSSTGASALPAPRAGGPSGAAGRVRREAGSAAADARRGSRDGLLGVRELPRARLVKAAALRRRRDDQHEAQIRCTPRDEKKNSAAAKTRASDGPRKNGESCRRRGGSCGDRPPVPEPTAARPEPATAARATSRATARTPTFWRRRTPTRHAPQPALLLRRRASPVSRTGAGRAR